ncbi:MAG: PhoU domain-containing protein [Nanoarchaeota archaeon]
MQRKLVQQGNSTLMVSLPSIWLKNNNLKKGNLIELEEIRNNIIISSNKSEIKKISKINISEKDLPIRRILLSLYEQGIDEIDLEFPQELIIEIEKIVNQLIGYEIIKQEKKYCKIQDITKSSEDDLHIITRRLFLLTKNMFDDAINAIKNNDKELIKHIEYRDIDINKFSYYAKRLINKNNNIDKIKYYQTVESLEFIGDELKRLFWHIIKNKSKFTKKDMEIFEKTFSLFNDSYNFIYQPEEKLLKI